MCVFGLVPSDEQCGKARNGYKRMQNLSTNPEGRVFKRHYLQEAKQQRTSAMWLWSKWRLDGWVGARSASQHGRMVQKAWHFLSRFVCSIIEKKRMRYLDKKRCPRKDDSANETPDIYTPVQSIHHAHRKTLPSSVRTYSNRSSIPNYHHQQQYP